MHQNNIHMVSATVLSDYEIERNKPIPSFNHGAIQANLKYEIFRTHDTLMDEKTGISFAVGPVFK